MIIFQATAAFVAVKDGAFDTRYRYLRERSIAGTFGIVSGSTCAMTAGILSGTSERWIAWKYQSGSYMIEETIDYGSGPVPIIAQTVSQSINQVDG